MATNFYDALVEQNSIYLDGETELEQVKENNQALKRLALRKEEWLKTYQFLLMKAGQTEPLQANHQFTPDTIALLLVLIVEELLDQEEISILEIGSGMGLLGATCLTSLAKKVDYLGIEVDDLLIDLAASMSDVIGLQAGFVQGDAVRPQMLKESDVVISDLPVGYYQTMLSLRAIKCLLVKSIPMPIICWWNKASSTLSQMAMLFLAPSDLLTSPQSDLLKGWLKDEVSLAAIIALPEDIFSTASQAKSIFVLQKKRDKEIEPFVYPLTSLQDPSVLLTFKENFQNWSKGTEI